MCNKSLERLSCVYEGRIGFVVSEEYDESKQKAMRLMCASSQVFLDKFFSSPTPHLRPTAAGATEKN